MKPQKIEVGKSYLNRLGEKTTIVRYLGGVIYPFLDERRNSFTEAGRYIEGKHHEYDLVSLADKTAGDNALLTVDGMTLRQYAAIKLRVPDSGTEWLDEMIRKSVRQDIAENIFHTIYSDFLDDVRARRVQHVPDDWRYGIAAESFKIADTMIKAGSEGGA